MEEEGSWVVFVSVGTKYVDTARAGLGLSPHLLYSLSCMTPSRLGPRPAFASMGAAAAEEKLVLARASQCRSPGGQPASQLPPHLFILRDLYQPQVGRSACPRAVQGMGKGMGCLYEYQGMGRDDDDVGGRSIVSRLYGVPARHLALTGV